MNKSTRTILEKKGCHCFGPLTFNRVQFSNAFVFCDVNIQLPTRTYVRWVYPFLILRTSNRFLCNFLLIYI